MRKLQRQPQKHLGPDYSVRDMRRPSWADANKMEAEIMSPRDRLQRLLFEHRTAHDPASSEREILAMFEKMEADRPPRFGRIGFCVDGFVLRLRGPVPAQVVDAVESDARFSTRAALFDWLDRTRPEWERYEEKHE